MDIQWQKIKEGIELFQRESTSVFVVPEVGRVYVSDLDEYRARCLGGNPICHLKIALAGIAGQHPLLVISEMKRLELNA